MKILSRLAIGAIATTVFVNMLAQPALAVGQLDALRSVPLEIDAYITTASPYPESFATADEVMTALNSKRTILFHMETIRRAYNQLPETQKGPLLVKLEKRYQAAPEDPVLFFDHGYAQLVFEKNKTGLFFLRKANDRLQDQFSAMAYAMAQAESDLRDEEGTPENMTSRKVSVIHLMQDAARRNAETPKPGFWPSFVRMMETLEPLPAYSNLTGTDFSLEAVPYGNLPQPSGPNISNALASEGGGGGYVPDEAAQSCSLTAEPDFDSAKAVNTKKLDLTNDGFEETVQFYKKDDGTYDVVVLDKNMLAMATFNTPVAPYIIEDLNDDNVYEIVIRQYHENPMDPVRVYRYDGCQYVPDTDIQALFQ